MTEERELEQRVNKTIKAICDHIIKNLEKADYMEPSQRTMLTDMMHALAELLSQTKGGDEYGIWRKRND